MTTPRIETDSLGTIAIPGDRSWGPQTKRAQALSAVGDGRLDPGMMHAACLQTCAAAQANRRGHPRRRA